MPTNATPLTKEQRYLAAILFIGAALPRLIIGPMIIDDAYITFRYADNIAQGNGFVYNAGSHVLGTTTPLWTLILALMNLLAVDLSWASVYWGAILDGFSASLLFLLGIRVRLSTVGFFAGWLLAGIPQSAFFAVSGMETSLYVFLILLGFYLTYSRKYLLSACAVALCVLTRPDGIIIAALILLHFCIREKRFPKAPTVAFLVIALPWFVFALLYFGSPVPNSVTAKVHYSTGTAQGWGNLGLFMDHYAGSPVRKALMLLFLYGSCVACIRSPRLLFFWLVFPIYGVALSLSKTYAGPFPWYFVPVLPAFLFFASAGAEALIKLSERSLGTKIRHIPIARLGYLIAGLILCFSGFNLSRNYKINQSNLEQREGRYQTIAKWASYHLPVDAVIAAREIGVLGYFSERKILDLNGLVSPEMHRFLAHNLDDSIRHFKPDMLVCFDTHFPCNTAYAIPEGVYHRYSVPGAQNPMFVYIKAGLPAFVTHEMDDE